VSKFFLDATAALAIFADNSDAEDDESDDEASQEDLETEHEDEASNNSEESHLSV